MQRISLKKSLVLLLTATIWGVAFVAQSVGMDYVGPFTFNAARSILGGLTLIPVIIIGERVKANRTGNGAEKGRVPCSREKDKKTLLQGGFWCGVMLFLGSSLQQLGIQYTSVGKAGFLTAMYIVLVPIVGIFFRKRVGLQNWIGVVLAVYGMYLLCIRPGEGRIQVGDLLLTACALAFTGHILVIDHFSPLVDGVKMSCIQFFVCAILSGIFMMILERPSVSAIFTAWLPIAYAGIMSSGVAYTLQIVAQKDMNPTVTSLILSLESVISLLAGWVILHQVLSGRELLGCAIVFSAIILVQLPLSKSKN